jgi:hypothetical protein
MSHRYKVLPSSMGTPDIGRRSVFDTECLVCLMRALTQVKKSAAANPCPSAYAVRREERQPERGLIQLIYVKVRTGRITV